MTNVTTRVEVIKNHRVSIPNPATARDLNDLMMIANRKYKEVTGEDPTFDDSYMIEADEENITAIIRDTN